MKIDAYCALGTDREYDLTSDALVFAMDRSCVDRAVIVPVDRYLAIDNRMGNVFIFKQYSKYSGRFIPSCSVNPWYGEKGIEELHRCVDMGARMLILHPFLQGFLLNDELIFPLLSAAAHKKLPIYIHTGFPGNSTPWQLVDLAERFSELDFIMGHCGATDFWNDVVYATNAVTNIYLESSLARPFAFRGYLNEVGSEKGIMGSYAPINDFSFEWEEMRKELPDDKWADVYGANILRLLEKRGVL